jgi:hypothetical protein
MHLCEMNTSLHTTNCQRNKEKKYLKNIALPFRAAKLIQKDIKNTTLSAFLFKKKRKSYKPAPNSRLFSQNESKDATNQTKA